MPCFCFLLRISFNNCTVNFAPVQLQVPDGIPVENVNLVMELEALSFQITRALKT